MTCQACGERIAIGDWPFCPHGHTRSFTVEGDECEYVIHNMGKHPRRFTSKAEHRRAMKELGLVHPERYVRHPEGKNQGRAGGVPDMRCADEYTMNYKRELLERAFKQRGDQRQERPLAVWDTHAMTKDEAKRYLG